MTLALLWQDGQRAVGLGSRLIRREDWAELVASNEALVRAQRCEQDSEQRAQAAERAAQARGYAAGLAQGREEGLRQVLQTLREENAFVNHLRELLVGLLAQTMQTWLQTQSEATVLDAQLRRCLQAAREAQGSRLLVAPAQLAAARDWVQEQLGAVPDWLQIETGPGLTGADVVLECQGAILDGRIAAQVQAWQRQVALRLDTQLQTVPPQENVDDR
jgi:flagellar biosynthesis/type III secretory pathway protein FliH